jgi:hypothetical protein
VRYGYRPRRRNTWGPPNAPVPKDTGPIEVDIETMLRSLSSAPSHRATTTSEITAPGAHQPARWRRNAVTLYDGRKRVELIPSGKVVIIDYEKWGWRISTSASAEPTPMLLRQGTVPHGADRVSESGGLSLYQTPMSLLTAALYQAQNNRRSIALAMIDEAIALKGKSATEEQINNISGKYKVFCALSATALSGSNSNSENLVEAASNEAATAFPHAVKRGTSIVQGEWQ